MNKLKAQNARLIKSKTITDHRIEKDIVIYDVELYKDKDMITHPVAKGTLTFTIYRRHTKPICEAYIYTTSRLESERTLSMKMDETPFEYIPSDDGYKAFIIEHWNNFLDWA